MKILVRLLLAACSLSPLAFAAEPPILDRELFFGDPEIAGAQISPDGKYISFLKPYNGTRNIWVKKTDEPFASAKVITNDTKRPIPGYFWSRDSRFVLYVQDKLGDENYQVYAVDPSAAPAAGSPVPEARNLTDAKGARAIIYSVPKTQPDILYIGLNDRDKAWHDLYKIKISTGEKTLVRKNTDRITGWEFDTKDQLRLGTRSAENGDNEILRVDPDKLTKVYSCSVFEQCSPVHFHKDNQRVYLETNATDAVNLTRLVLFDPGTMKEEKVESDPLNRVDLGGAMFSDVTDDLILTSYEDDRIRRYFKDKAFEADYQWLAKQLPGKEIRPGSHTRDERIWLINAVSDTEPGETYLFNRDTKKLTLQYRVREGIPRDALASMQPIRYESSDGLEIPAYLTLPKGSTGKNLPLIVFPHGGPWGRDSWGYNSMAQFFANRGYAVLSPNFRASTGYGKKFLNAGNLQWGDKMQDDLTWGVKYLVAKGIADPKRVGIMGGSYGGYATLAGVAFTPDVYAAAVSIVGPSNLITLLNSIPPYWESIRKMFTLRMGDPATPEGKAQLMRQSPLNSASKIKTPLMVVQGANDPRVNKAESDQIVIALRDRKFPVEYIVAPDEGHGFARPVNNLATFMAAEKFLAQHLGGRYQEGGKPEVVARLKEITVDPQTVVLAKAVDPNSVSLPKPASSLQPGTSKYQANIEVGGQNIKLDMTSTIKKDESGGWAASDVTNTPMGEMTDRTVLDKDSLVLLKRTIQQGPMTINLEFKGNQATGTMSANGQDRPISADMGGPLYGDGAGGIQVLALLPLADGYATVIRSFDATKQQAKLTQLKVVGSEKVTVPAGTFDAYKVDMTPDDGSADKSTLWVDKSARKPVKVVATLSQMGGAVLTIELLP